MNYKKINHAFIMAAGRGTRLRPLTKKIPKGLIKFKQSSLIATRNNAVIHLFSNSIIGTHFARDDNDNHHSSYFEIQLITTVPYFMSLDVGTAVILSPTLNKLTF